MPLLMGLAIGVGVGLLLGGGENEISNTNKQTTNVITESLSSISNDLTNEIRQDVTASQKMTINAGNITLSGEGTECNITATQDMAVGVHGVLSAVTSLDSTQMAELATKVANSQSQQLEQVNKKLNLGNSNKAKVDNDITTHIQNEMTSIVNNSIKNMNMTTVSTSQENIIKLGDITAMDGAKCNLEFNQNMALDIVSEQMSDQVTSSLQSLKTYTDVSNKQSTAISQLNEGIEPMASSGSSCGSCIISVIAIVAGGLLPALIPSGGNEGRAQMDNSNLDADLNYEMGGGAPPKRRKMKYNKKQSGGGFEMTPGKIMILLICAILLFFFGFYVYTYWSTQPKHLTPSEKDCSKNWDETIKISSWALRKTKFIENCRMEHHFCATDRSDENGNEICKKGEASNKGQPGYDANGKPLLFGPRSETLCAWAKRRHAEGKEIEDHHASGCNVKESGKST
jgi:hypothetical protein